MEREWEREREQGEKGERRERERGEGERGERERDSPLEPGKEGTNHLRLIDDEQLEDRERGGRGGEGGEEKIQLQEREREGRGVILPPPSPQPRTRRALAGRGGGALEWRRKPFGAFAGGVITVMVGWMEYRSKGIYRPTAAGGRGGGAMRLNARWCEWEAGGGGGDHVPSVQRRGA